MQHFIVNLNNDINLSEVVSECQKDKWCPLLILRDKEKTYIPCFDVQSVAYEYARRNLKKQPFGIVSMPDIDIERMRIEFIEKLNWEFRLLKYPKLEKFTIDIALHYFVAQPDVRGYKGTRLIKESLSNTDYAAGMVT